MRCTATSQRIGSSSRSLYSALLRGMLVCAVSVLLMLDSATVMQASPTSIDSAVLAPQHAHHASSRRRYADTQLCDSLRDTSSLTRRSVSAKRLADIFAKGDYVYDRRAKDPAPSWWQRLMRWLGRGFNINPGTHTGAFVEDLFIYGSALLFIIMMVLWLSKGGFRGLVRRSETGSELSVEEEVIQLAVDDLQARSRAALAEGDYRRALRYMFLYELRCLVDEGFVVYDAAKTNREYGRELKAPELSRSFRDIAVLFEGVWYGEYQLSAEDFHQAQKIYEHCAEVRKGARVPRPTTEVRA